MPVTDHDRICFDFHASDLAFRAGQVVEKLLLDRGLEQARKCQSSIVTPEDVESGIDDSLLDHLRKHLHERAEQESRKVA